MIRKKNRTNSYRIDAFKFSQSEIRLLEKRASFNIEIFKNSLSTLNPASIRHVLEVGCGTGYRSGILARTFPNASVIGLDMSLKMTELASQRFQSYRNLSFRNGDIRDFALTARKRFDLIYLRLVLQHVRDASEILSYCRKLLKPKGVILIEDIDRQFMAFHPPDAEWKKWFDQAVEYQHKSGGDPHIGRKIQSLLEGAGFRQIENLSYVHTGGKGFFNEWIEFFAPSHFNNLPETKRVLALRRLKRLKRENRKTRRTTSQTWFLFRAKK